MNPLSLEEAVSSHQAELLHDAEEWRLARRALSRHGSGARAIVGRGLVALGRRLAPEQAGTCTACR